MLQHLSIRNYALISTLEIDFKEDLTIITGETGAGKSILLGALALILGQRADTQSLSDKTQKCIIEGLFDIQHYQLEDFFKKHELDYSAGTIIRREITPSGSSRAFINDTPVTLQQLKELGIQLVDVHSQHESLLLNTAAFQFLIVDSFAGLQKPLLNYQDKYRGLINLQEELKRLIEQENKALLDKDYFQFQYDELDQAALADGEQESLESELALLNNAEAIKKNMFESAGALNSGENSIIPILAEVNKYVAEATKFNPLLEDIKSRLLSVFIELKDIADELDKAQDKISFDPKKIEIIEMRLNIIYSLQQKHRVKSVKELLGVKENFAGKLAEITSLDQTIISLKERTSRIESELIKEAKKISEARCKAIPRIEKNINSMMTELGMPNAKIEINHRVTENCGLTMNGIDQLRFLFSANKGSPPKEISKIASGGELSRLMLSVKSLLAQFRSLPTVIFDEIDTGVSGEIADKVGVIMQKMAGEMQVISVTHLPQIASKGKHHFFVYKESLNGSTITRIKQLSEKDRVKEIARLLSGETLTQAAIENAKALLNA